MALAVSDLPQDQGADRHVWAGGGEGVEEGALLGLRLRGLHVSEQMGNGQGMGWGSGKQLPRQQTDEKAAPFPGCFWASGIGFQKQPQELATGWSVMDTDTQREGKRAHRHQGQGEAAMEGGKGTQSQGG